MRGWFERSVPGRLLDRAGALPAELLRRLAADRKDRRPACRGFLAAGTAVMLCVPHTYWNNLCGVLFILGALALYWWDCACAGTRPQNPAGLGGGAWLFLTVCLIRSLTAYSRAGSLRVFIFYAAGFCLIYLVAAVFSREKDASLLTGFLYGALILTSIYGLLRYAFGSEDYYVPMLGRLYPRLSSTLEHGINCSEYIAMALPVSLVWALEKKGPSRWLLTGLLLLPCGAILLTYARTGWLALWFALLLLVWYKDKRWLIPIAVLGAAAMFLLPLEIVMRIMSMLQLSDAAASGRFTLWGECLAALREHWLTGVGLGPENFLHAYLPFSSGTLDFTPPHANMGYLEMLLSAGVVGFAGFAAFFFGIFPRLGAAAKREADPSARRRGRALTAALAGAALANIPEHLWFYPRVFFFWCVLYGLALGYCRERE